MEGYKGILAFFNELSKESKKLFIDILEKKEYKKNEYIIKQGEVLKKFHFVKNGIVRSFIKDENGKEFTRTIFTSNLPTGSLSSLILNKPSELYYECLTDCEIYEGDYLKFRKLTKERLDFANQYNTILEKTFLKMESKVYDLAVLNATERYLKMKKEIPNIENLITQYHIAYYLNITPVQLSRIRKNLLEK